MPPERYPLSQDDGDGGGGVGSLTVNGGGTAIIGGHVTVETSSPVASPSPAQFDATTTTVATPINGSSMVLSTIPVETTHQLILQQHLAHPVHQQHHIITTGSTASNPSAISSSVTGNTGIIINNNNNNNTSFKNHNNIIISSSGALATAANGNNHTYTINLSSGSHAGGHAVLTNGIPLQSYTTSVTTSNTNNNNSTTLNHSHHHHQQQQHQQQYHHLHPAPNSSGSGSVANMATVHGNGTTTTVAGQTTVVAPPPQQQQQPSKLVVLQQGHLGENYITTTEGINGVGNIVLLATEQMDSSDHEIQNGSGGSSTVSNNLVITSSSSSSSSSNNSHGHQQLSHHQHHAIRTAAATLTSNGVVVNGVGANDEELTPLTWLHDKNLLKGINLSKVPVSSPDSPRQVAGRLSPTSDFVEDSSVSEDNTSSANSSSDQGIGVYCTETIHPGGRAVHHSTLHHVQQAPQHHHTTFQLSNGSGHKTIIHGDTIIEYTADEKELKSPSSTVSCASSSSSSPPSSSNSSLYSSSSPSPNPNTVVTSQGGMVHNGGGNSSGGSGASTPHQHFHKKYLREEHVKQLKQVSSSYATTPVKQQSTLKFDDGDLVDERPYPSAPIKNGGTGAYTMAASPNVSSDEYSSTYGGSMKPPSPPLSPQQMGAATTLSGIHVLPQQQHQQPPASPLPSPVGSSNGSKLSPPKAKHPTNVPYDPQVHVHSKPPFSFSSLIFMAIENCQQKALPVKEIYAWIVQHFPYFKTAPTGWKNSVRHNLSLNKCFQKVEKAANLGKGSLWMVEPQYRPNLIQALSRSPFHSGSGIDKTTYKAMQAQQQQQQHQRSTDSPTSSIGSSYSKDNYPYLASRLTPGEAQSHLHHLHDQQHPGHPDLDGDDFSRSSTPIDYDGGDLPHPTVTAGSYHVTYHPAPATVGTTNGGINYSATAAIPPNDSSSAVDTSGRNWSADTIDDVNAATAMLALKHGPKVFTEGFHNGSTVITKSPSEDHTYSAGGSLPGVVVPSERSSQANSDNNSNGTSSDAAYESSEESQTLTATDLEEQRRQAGVDALLNLAGITNFSTPPPPNNSLKRPASSMLEPDQPSTPSSTAVIYQQQQYLESTPPSGYSVVVQSGPQPAHRNNYYLPAAEELTVGGLHHQQYSSPSPPKKSKTASARMLKKFKKKATWVR